MRKTIMAGAALAGSLALGAAFTQTASTPEKSPGEIAAAALVSEWRDIPATDLLVMELAGGRRVTIQLVPAPFSQGWVGNIRKLAAARWWDGTSINRVQDNYVVQWGDATEKKPLPPGLATVPAADYSPASPLEIRTVFERNRKRDLNTVERSLKSASGQQRVDAITATLPKDAYARETGHWSGWPVATDYRNAWPVHCYAMVGVGRNLAPDTGSGAELYTVIGHAPRHLDRNIALVGRVIDGIEHLSSLPRGTGALGFYEKAEQRVPIVSVRVGSETAWQYLDSAGATFAAYADARANRRDPFFNVPAGGADICNVPVPIRRKP